MPANKKYLTKSPWIRLLKIIIGFVGGYIVMMSFHLALARIFPQQNVVATAFFTGYMLWAILLLLAFIAKNVWKLLAVYAGLTLIFSLPFLIA